MTRLGIVVCGGAFHSIHDERQYAVATPCGDATRSRPRQQRYPGASRICADCTLYQPSVMWADAAQPAHGWRGLLTGLGEGIHQRRREERTEVRGTTRWMRRGRSRTGANGEGGRFRTRARINFDGNAYLPNENGAPRRFMIFATSKASGNAREPEDAAVVVESNGEQAVEKRINDTAGTRDGRYAYWSEDGCGRRDGDRDGSHMDAGNRDQDRADEGNWGVGGRGCERRWQGKQQHVAHVHLHHNTTHLGWHGLTHSCVDATCTRVPVLVFVCHGCVHGLRARRPVAVTGRQAWGRVSSRVNKCIGAPSSGGPLVGKPVLGGCPFSPCVPHAVGGHGLRHPGPADRRAYAVQRHNGIAVKSVRAAIAEDLTGGDGCVDVNRDHNSNHDQHGNISRHRAESPNEHVSNINDKHRLCDDTSARECAGAAVAAAAAAEPTTDAHIDAADDRAHGNELDYDDLVFCTPRAAKRRRGPRIYKRFGYMTIATRVIIEARKVGRKRIRERRRQRRQRPGMRRIAVLRCTITERTESRSAKSRSVICLVAGSWRSRFGPAVRTGEADNPGPRSHDDAQRRTYITSGNVTGWGTALDWLPTVASDVLCLQEHKQRDDEDVAAASTQAKERGWKSMWTNAITAPTEPGGASAGVAILAKNHIGMLEPPGGHEVYKGRAVAALIEAGATGGIIVYSIYLVSGDELGDQNWRILKTVAEHIAMHGLPWICIGDWNVPPQVLAASGWANRIDAKVIAPPVHHTTRSGARAGRLIDYCVAAKRIADVGIHIGIDDLAPLKTHDAVCVALPVAPRQFEVTHLLAPRLFPKERPIGPRKRPPEAVALRRSSEAAVAHASAGRAGDAIAALNEAVDYLLDQLEYEFINLYHLDETEGVEEFRGRSRGHKFVRAPVLGPRHRGYPRGDPSARRLRMLQDRANDLAGSIGRACGRAAPTADLNERIRAAISTATYVMKDKSLAADCALIGAELRKTARMLEACVRRRANVDVATWASDAQLGALRKIADEADDAAQPAEKRHRNVAARNVAEWCKVAQSNGAGLAHRWTQVPVAWRPEAAETYDGVEIGRTSNPDVLVRKERDKWAPLWRPAGVSEQEIEWGYVPPLPRPTVAEVRAAANRFKRKTRVGIEGISPKDMSEATDETLDCYINIMIVCEMLGHIPTRVALVIVLLLNKKLGGRRPIGIMPTMYRVWAAVRKPLLHRWERAYSRGYFAAARGKSAADAAWNRALRAEHATLVGASAGSILWDLRKCFEHGNRALLAREAEALQFPLAMARLAVAMYAAERRLCLDGAFSDPVEATRGFIAGCAWALACIKVTLVRRLDAYVIRHPHADSEFYVDDVEVQSVGQAKSVVRDLVAAAVDLADILENTLGYPLAADKAVVIASDDAIAAEIIKRTDGKAGKLVRVTEKLGIEYTAGKRRPKRGGPRRERLRRQLARQRRITKFRKLGGSARVVAARGQLPAAMYDGAVNGVSDAELYRLRGIMSRAIAPTSRGSYTLLKLMMDDDPAIRANGDVLGRWAATAWRAAGPTGQRKQGEPTAGMLQSAMAAAIRNAAENPSWEEARGPAGGTVRTAMRLGWTFHDAFKVTDELNVSFDMGTMDPRSVREKVRRATQAATARQIAKHERMPQLRDGVWSAPVRSALRSKRMNPAARACLRRAFAGGYWTGARRAAAGLAESATCDCGAGLDDAHHRLYECPLSQATRSAYLNDYMLTMAKAAARDDPLWTRALARDPAIDLPGAKREHEEHWYFADDDAEQSRSLSGDVFIDGSALHPKCPPARRAGWTALELRADGTVRAAVYGPVPVDISPTQTASAGELHGFRRAAELACGTIRCYTDYQTAVEGNRRGPDATTHHKTASASSWRGFWRATDDQGLDVTKVIAHRSMREAREDEADEQAVWKKAGNDAADSFAKKGAALHHTTTQMETLKDYVMGEAELKDLAVFIGMALANWAPAPRNTRLNGPPHERRREVRRRRIAAAAKFGHRITWTRNGWSCASCGRGTATTAGLRRLELSPCTGHTGGRLGAQGAAPSAHVLWAAEADATATGPAGADIVWCSRCGGYSSTKLYKLAGSCSGVTDHSARTRLASLQSLRHPTLGYRLAAPVRLTDAVIDQLKQAGDRQRDSFNHVLREVLQGHGEGAQVPRSGGDSGSIYPCLHVDIVGGREQELVGNMECEGPTMLGSAQSEGPNDGQPCHPRAETNQQEPREHVPCGEDDAARARRNAVRSTAARVRIEAIKERIRRKQSVGGGRSTAVETEDDRQAARNPEASSTARCDTQPGHLADDDDARAIHGRDDSGRPVKARRLSDESGMDVPRGSVHDRAIQMPYHGAATCGEIADEGAADMAVHGSSATDAGSTTAFREVRRALDNSITNVGSLSSRLGEPLNAARGRLLCQLRGQGRIGPPPGAPARAGAAADRADGGVRRATSQAAEQFVARGTKRGASHAGADAGNSFGDGGKRRRLRGKQPPRCGIG